MSNDKAKLAWRKLFLFFHAVAWSAIILLIVLSVRLLNADAPTASAGLNGDSPTTTAKVPEQGTIQLENGHKSEAEIMQRLNEEAEKGMFHIFMNTDITLDENGQADLYLQNIEKNHDACIVEIYDKQTHDLYYKSELILPGYKVEHDKLATRVTKGEHACLAKFIVVDIATKQHKNEIGLNVTITA